MSQTKTQVFLGQSPINGFSQQQLADQWVVQVLSTPPADSPFSSSDAVNPRGMRGSIELHDSFNALSPSGVYFLGGATLSDPNDPSPTPAIRTIVGRPNTVYFAPFVNIFPDNTTNDFSLGSDYSGGYALTPQHLSDLTAQGLLPRSYFGFPTLLDVAQFVLDSSAPLSQFLKIDSKDKTPTNIELYRQETSNVSYSNLPRSTGALFGTESTYLADPDLGVNLDNLDPQDDSFPLLSDVKAANPDLNGYVVPFVQAGYYFAFELDKGSHTVNFGETVFQQDVTYNVLNPVEGNNSSNILLGTSGNDYLNAKGGKDALFGFGGDDLLLGGTGKDYLSGGQGDDELWGDQGKDTFFYESGKDTIFDFEKGEQIFLKKFNGLPEVSEVVLGSTMGATQIKFSETDILTLVDIETSDLSVNFDNSLVWSITNR